MLTTINLDINKQFNGFLFENSNNKLHLITEKLSFLKNKTIYIDSSFLKDKSITYLSMKQIKVKKLEKNKFKNLLSVTNLYDSTSFEKPIYNKFYHYKDNDNVLYGLSMSKISGHKGRLDIIQKVLFLGKLKGKAVVFTKNVNDNEVNMKYLVKNLISKDLNSIVYNMNYVPLLEKLIFSDYIFKIAELNEIENIIYNDFPFLKNKKEKNILKLFWVDICFPLYSALFKDYRLFEEEAKEYASFNRKHQSHLERNLRIKFPKNIDVMNLLSETSQLKQLKVIVPKANRETLSLFNKPTVKAKTRIFDNFHFSFLNLFHSSQKMNEALRYIKVHNCILYSFEKQLNKSELNLIKDKFSNADKFDDAIINQLDYLEKHYNSMDKTTYILDDLIGIKNMMIRNERLFKSIYKEKSRPDVIAYKLDSYNDFKKKKYSSIDELSADVYNLNSFLECKNDLFFYQSIGLKEIKNHKYIMKEIENSGELKLIGERLANCLFSYKENINNKNISIFYVKNTENNKIEACIEYNVKNHSITQVKKKYNETIKSKSVLNFIMEWIELNDLSLETGDINKEKVVE